MAATGWGVRGGQGKSQKEGQVFQALLKALGGQGLGGGKKSPPIRPYKDCPFEELLLALNHPAGESSSEVEVEVEVQVTWKFK